MNTIQEMLNWDPELIAEFYQWQHDPVKILGLRTGETVRDWKLRTDKWKFIFLPMTRIVYSGLHQHSFASDSLFFGAKLESTMHDNPNLAWFLLRKKVITYVVVAEDEDEILALKLTLPPP